MDDQRYIRQTILPEIGPGGQEKLAHAAILIAGTGGLGSVTALYLAAAGIAASFQAMETIKLLLGIGKTLKNRMLRISGLDMRIHSLTLRPNPECQACKRI